MSAEARELAQRFGVRMCDENCMTHGEELYCLGLDDIIAMKEALAKQEQSVSVGEPVAWLEGETIYWREDRGLNDWIRKNGQPLYTTPQQRKPLTDEQIEDLCWTEVDQRLRSFARAIEAAHGIRPSDFKEKNT